VIPRRYGQIKRQAGEGVALQVDAADALTRFARILAVRHSSAWSTGRLLRLLRCGDLDAYRA
jgi:hypothetical protein